MSNSNSSPSRSDSGNTLPGSRALETCGQPFPATRWSMIEGCKDPEGADFRSSLEVLCVKYWPPVYWFIRRHWGKSREEAKDLCQEFFLEVFEQEFIRSFDVEKGRFRSFVCGALQRFLSRQHRDANRQKRSPSEGRLFSMEALSDDGRSFDVPDQRPGVEDVEAAFRTEWKKSVVHNALDRMREEVRGTEKETSVDVFARYRIEHEEGSRPTRVELGEAFAMTLHQVHYALRWGEKEFFRFLREELMDQVSTTEDFESEARELFGIA